jgi:histidine triad (HIT) family protein
VKVQDCLFCRIVAGEAEAVVVAETPDAVTFLDHRPIFPGHALVVPRVHVETLRDVPAGLLLPFFAEVQRVAAGVQDGMEAEGTFVAENNVISQSVPHLHVHVVPRRRKDGLRGFFWPRTKYEDGEAKAAAIAIRAALPDRM